MGDLTKHFSLSEFIVSDSFPEIAETIDLDPDDKIKAFYMCAIILEPTRLYLNKVYEGKVTIHPTRGKQNPALFEALREAGYNPSPTSDHNWVGLKVATDFIVKIDKKYSKDATRKAYSHIKVVFPTAYGQLIYYPGKGHVHLSFPTETNHGEHWVQE